MSAQTATADTLSYMFERAAETMPRSELKALQLARLKTTLERAYNKIPHYKKKFDAANVKPGDLKSLADLARFPFTVKTDLRDNYPFGMFAVPQDQLLRLHASSGTTGKPTVVGYTKGDLNLWADLMARCLASMGARPGDIVHKVGRTTGLTEGPVLAVDVSMRVAYHFPGFPAGTAMFVRQIIAHVPCAYGDSGSLLLDGQNRAVGLLFGGTEGHTYFNPFTEVEKALDVRLVRDA